MLMFRRLRNWFRGRKGFIVLSGMNGDDALGVIIARFKDAGYDVVTLGGGPQTFQVFRY